MKRTEEERARLRSRAVEMRAAGIGSKRIAKQLGIGGALACELLRGVPVPGSLQRPQAKDELREAAVLLRQQGRTYDEIQDELGVSKSSLSLWLRDLPHPTAEQRSALTEQHLALPLDEPTSDIEIARLLRLDGWLLREIAAALGVAEKTACLWTRGLPVPARAMHGRSPDQSRAMGRASWVRRLAQREEERQAVKAEAGSRVGQLSARELELIAVTAYWCEGSKDKSYDRREQVKFINSDPGLIDLFFQWLRRIGVPEEHFRFRVHIHETANIPGAERFWAELLGVPVTRFLRPTIKRHNPKTVRANLGEGYYGCLVISVCQSRVLYQQIAGTWQGVVDAQGHGT